MRWHSTVAGLSALIATGFAQDASTEMSCNANTGMCYSTFTSGSSSIQVGVAIPESATNSAAYDIIFEIVSPIDFGWVGVSWGGSMTYVPLSVAWPNGDQVMVSSRMAYGYYVPSPYEDSTHTILEGSGVNETHWTLNALCSGCAAWEDFDGNLQVLTVDAPNYLALGASYSPVDEPDNEQTTFSIHSLTSHWYHDFGAGASPDFEEWADNAESPPASSSASTTEPTTTQVTTTASSTTEAQPTLTDTGEALPLPSSCGLSARFSTTTASGWQVAKIKGSLTRPRMLAVDSLGNLLAAESGKGISVHSFGPDGCIASSKNLITNAQLNHAVTFSPDGKTLYASSTTTLWAWPYDAETQTVGSSTVMVKGMNLGGHPSRSTYISPKHPNLAVIQVGSENNFDMAAVDPATPRANVRVFDLSSVPSGGYDYATQGWLLGYGLRNEVALAFDGDGNVWGVENSGDQFTRTPQNGGASYDIHNTNPAEELNYLGNPAEPNDNWYGYPTCFTVWDPSVFTDASFSTGDVFINEPNSTFNDATCRERTVGPRLSFPAHSAPIDAHFDPGFENLYVTFHGSWNTDAGKATGYKVVQIPFKQSSGSWGGREYSYEPVASSDSQNGFKQIWGMVGESNCDMNSCLRPAGIIWDNAGTRMYVSSDNTLEGEIFVLYQPSSSGSEGSDTSTTPNGGGQTTTTPTPTTTTTRPQTTTTQQPSCTQTQWGQCAGQSYPGCTNCGSFTCVYLNDWYSQCQ